MDSVVADYRQRENYNIETCRTALMGGGGGGTRKIQFNVLNNNNVLKIPD